jgi:hypothetical protein
VDVLTVPVEGVKRGVLSCLVEEVDHLLQGGCN